MTFSTSAVAACCSRASSRSRVSRATSVWPRDERPRDTALGALPPFRLNALRGRALAGLWPALERLFIASTRMSAQGIVACQSSTDHGTRACLTLCLAAHALAATPARRSQPAAIGPDGEPSSSLLARFSPLLESWVRRFKRRPHRAGPSCLLLAFSALYEQ